ncbi:MerR family transcriptional regulator [Paraburkholderia caledonica]|uniref:DNA-binding transcriptional MerR regulator n=1 Tax=Paraburkholderia caledonica TaxID=134536 RepID=A0ABU1KSA0_9BURK|nr:MerR family transcriptional regulator [Paraburkholderia caledonica]MDR6373829.1 DNA-binding transcriptional MerR regulator [Paraburkholderia caledonica]
MSNDSPALLTVRDAAERLGVTPRTLKYYEERGLVSPARSEGRYRLYDDNDLQRFGRILRLRSLGFSLHGITEMLKRPLEPVAGGHRFSTESLQQIHDAIAQQVDALDARIQAMRRELKEAQKLRDELSPDLDYLKRRLAGENADALLEQRRNALAKGAKASKTAKGREEPQAPKTVQHKEAGTRSAAKPGNKPRASTARKRS